jgi:hypothetical protein
MKEFAKSYVANSGKHRGKEVVWVVTLVKENNESLWDYKNDLP